MRKAFDANVPKLRPRLGRAVTAPAGEEAAPEMATATAEGESAGVTAAEAAPTTAPAPTASPTASPAATAIPAATSGAIPTAIPSPTAIPTTTTTTSAARARVPEQVELDERIQDAMPAPAADAPQDDVLSRKARLDKIKRKVAEAARPQPRMHPVPADPARAAESVLGLVRDLEAELVRAREREDALKGDLDEARHELARVAGEARSAAERLGVAEHELEEKRGVLGELLAEMQALEEERDASVRRAQALATLDEERAKLLEDLGRRGDEEARLRAEREAEVERLSEELRLAGADGARLRAAVGELARERDQLGADLDRARRERDELAEAKRALEAVHAALAQARARIA